MSKITNAKRAAVLTTRVQVMNASGSETADLAGLLLREGCRGCEVDAGGSAAQRWLREGSRCTVVCSRRKAGLAKRRRAKGV